jgi:biopolymer transport protein ExbD
MPKVKIPRKSVIVDMTAMCDVSFLLLTFFILTAKFRPSETVMIDTPTSRATTKAPDDRLTIVVDSLGKAYLEFSVPKRRTETLQSLIERYGNKYPQLKLLTPEDIANFSNIETFGNSIGELPTLLKLKSDDLKRAKLTGVPRDSADNQLGDWVNAARYSALNDGLDLPIAIKGDKNTDVTAVQDIIEIMREREVFRFNLLTTQEGKID